VPGQDVKNEQIEEDGMQILGNMRLRTKFMAVILAISIIPFAVIGLISKIVTGNAIKVQVNRQLILLRDVREKQIQDYFDDIFKDIGIFSHRKGVLDLFNPLCGLDTAANPNGAFDITNPDYQKLIDQMGKNIQNYFEQSGYADIYMICAKHGHVMFSCARQADLGTDLNTGPYKASGLAALWKKIVKTRKPGMVDFQPYAPSGNQPAAFIGYPVIGTDDTLNGVIAFQISPNTINSLLSERNGQAETEETYLVGSDNIMRSDSFLDPGRFSVKASFANPQSGRVDTDAVREALAGHTGEGEIRNYNGHMVFSAYAPLKIGDITWAIMAEIQNKDAYRALDSLNWLMGTVALLTVVAIVLTVFLVIRSITGPLNKSIQFVKRISVGDFTERLEIKRNDEVGILFGTMNQGVSNLRHTIAQLVEAAEPLAAASTELSAISRQMSGNSANTYERSCSVAASAEEMSANLTSVAAAAEQASTNVTMVATASEEMTATINEIARNAEKARKITNQAVTDAQNASETVHDLGNAAHEIGKVTETIADISDQTNLLALNATIEAARAGDAGKGFAVVANEIKELAKQTAEATREIKGKIESIQASTSGTVDRIQQISQVINDINEIVSSIATAVEEQSITTNDIAGNVAQAARGIHEVTQNVAQSSDVSQSIARDISGVNHAAEEISANSTQVNMNAEELKKLACRLKDIVAMFKI
jgi:methyl-accepting chemotaxis protein